MHFYKTSVSTFLFLSISLLYWPYCLAVSRGDILKAIPEYLNRHDKDDVGWHRARDSLILFAPIMSLLNDEREEISNISDFGYFRDEVVSYSLNGHCGDDIYNEMVLKKIFINPGQGMSNFGSYNDFLVDSQDGYLIAIKNNYSRAARTLTSTVNPSVEAFDNIEWIIDRVQQKRSAHSEIYEERKRPLFFTIPAAHFLNDDFVTRWVEIVRSKILSTIGDDKSKDTEVERLQYKMELLAEALLNQYGWLIKAKMINEFKGVLNAIGRLLVSPDVLNITSELAICSIPNLADLFRSNFTQETLDAFASDSDVSEWQYCNVKPSFDLSGQRDEMGLLLDRVDLGKKKIKEKSDWYFEVRLLVSESDSEKKQCILSSLFGFFDKRLSRRNSDSVFTLYGSYALRVWLKYLYGNDCGLVTGNNINLQSSLEFAVGCYLNLLGENYSLHANQLINTANGLFEKSDDFGSDVFIEGEGGAFDSVEMSVKLFVRKDMSGNRYVLIKFFEFSSIAGSDGRLIVEAVFKVIDENKLVYGGNGRKRGKIFYSQSGCDFLYAAESMIICGKNREHLKSIFEKWEKEENSQHKLGVFERQYFYKIYNDLTTKVSEVDPVLCDKDLLSNIFDSKGKEKQYFEFLRYLSKSHSGSKDDFIEQFEYIKRKVSDEVSAGVEDEELLSTRFWCYAWHANQLFYRLSSLENANWIDIKRVLDIGFMEFSMLLELSDLSETALPKDKASLYSCNKIPAVLIYICDTFNDCEKSGQLIFQLLSKYVTEEKASTFNSLIVKLDKLLTINNVGVEALKYKGLLFEIYFSLFNDLHRADIALSDAVSIWNKLRKVPDNNEFVKSFFSSLSKVLERLLTELDFLCQMVAEQEALPEESRNKLSIANSLVNKIRGMKHREKIDHTSLFKMNLLADQVNLVNNALVNRLCLDGDKGDCGRSNKKTDGRSNKRKVFRSDCVKNECKQPAIIDSSTEQESIGTIEPFYPEEWTRVRDQAFHDLRAKKYKEAVNGYEDAKTLLPASASASDECRHRLFIATTEARFEWVRSDFAAIESIVSKVREYRTQFDHAIVALAKNDCERLDTNKSELIDSIGRLISKLLEIRWRIMASAEEMYQMVGILKVKDEQFRLKNDQDGVELSSLQLFFAEEKHEELFKLQEKQSEMVWLIDGIWGARKTWLQLIRKKGEWESIKGKKTNDINRLQGQSEELKKLLNEDLKRVAELKEQIGNGG